MHSVSYLLKRSTFVLYVELHDPTNVEAPNRTEERRLRIKLRTVKDVLFFILQKKYSIMWFKYNVIEGGGNRLVCEFSWLQNPFCILHLKIYSAANGRCKK